MYACSWESSKSTSVSNCGCITGIGNWWLALENLELADSIYPIDRAEPKLLPDRRDAAVDMLWTRALRAGESTTEYSSGSTSGSPNGSSSDSPFKERPDRPVRTEPTDFPPVVRLLTRLLDLDMLWFICTIYLYRKYVNYALYITHRVLVYG